MITRVVYALSDLAESIGRAEGGLAWPTKEERKDFKLPGIEPEYSIDGMHIRIENPSKLDADKRKAYDWSKDEVFGDSVIQPQRATTARQIKNAQIAVDGAKIEHARVDYDALDRAERQRTTNYQFAVEDAAKEEYYQDVNCSLACNNSKSNKKNFKCSTFPPSTARCQFQQLYWRSELQEKQL